MRNSYARVAPQGEQPECVTPHLTPEQHYAAFASADHRKALGQFFTPPRVADLMADWIGGIRPTTVLDPAMGTGVLTRAVRSRCPGIEVTAYEIDPEIMSYSQLQGISGLTVHNKSYLSADYEMYDGIIMNPPYIRHREIEGYETERGKISVKSGFIIPKSANLYVYFVVKACLQIKKGGRGAFLIPTEWMNANFSTGFKKFLLKKGGLSQIVIFSGCSNIFQDAITTASVLLVDN
jgi:type I restriction-modification system DNA methylase subunit